MRYDLEFDYDYLLQKIQDKYKANTLNQSIDLFCKDVYYFTPLKFKRVVMYKRGYFLQNEIYKMSKALDLSDADIIKCFYQIKEVNDGYSN